MKTNKRGFQRMMVLFSLVGAVAFSYACDKGEEEPEAAESEQAVEEEESAQAVECGTNAQGFEGATGTQHTVACPANCTSGSVWGTNIYSDDSSICRAAMHTGVIDASGGEVTFEIADGRSEYIPTSHNGVTTSRWGSWGRSFTIVGAEELPLPSANAIECTTNAQGLQGEPGTVHTVTCPANCSVGTVWGVDTYSDDSSVCRAAIHAGVIQADAGGDVQVTIAPGQESYQASTRNGVTTSTWGSWGRSFTVAAPAQ